MHRSAALRGVLVALVIVLSVTVGLGRPVEITKANYVGPPAAVQNVDVPMPDMASLLAFPFPAHIEDLAGADLDGAISQVLAGRPEADLLESELGEKGFSLDLALAEAMRVTLCRRYYLPVVLKNYSGVLTLPGPGLPAGELPASATSVDGPCTILMVVVPAVPSIQAADGLSAFLVGMLADDGTAFYQAHHTNLDPHLAEVPDPPIIFNNMSYFYVTTLRVVQDRIVPWHYWWFDSQNHRNWYYACYQFYWGYYHGTGLSWPVWHHWAYGWIYWRFWYYWSTWFPWGPAGP